MWGWSNWHWRAHAVACVLLAAALWQPASAARRHRQLLDHLPQTVVAVFDRELRVRSPPARDSRSAGRRPEVEG